MEEIEFGSNLGENEGHLSIFDRNKLEDDIARINACFQEGNNYVATSGSEESEYDDSEEDESEAPTTCELQIVGASSYATVTDEDSLTNAIALNRSYQAIVTSCIQRLDLGLQDNLEKQRALQEEINNMSRKKKRNLHSNTKVEKSFTVFATPYFKDKKGFAQPYNDDAKQIKAMQSVDPYIRAPKIWTKLEQKVLLEGIQNSAKEEAWHALLNKKEVLCSKLEKLSGSDDAFKEISTQVAVLDEKIEAVNNSCNFEAIGNRWKKHDWMKISVVDFDGTRSARECELIWMNYLHPDINTKRWLPAEDAELANLASMSNDWDYVSKMMKNNRTAQQCIHRYQNELNPDFVRSKWTEEEDKNLTEIIESCRIGDYIPWQKVMYYMKGRTRNQLVRRWFDSLDPKLIKGRWTELEDMALIVAVERHGKNWQTVKNYVAGRNSNQCRDRWMNCLSTEVQFGTWSDKEDEILVSAVLFNGPKWAKVAQCLPGRTDAMVARRYNLIMNRTSTYRSENSLASDGDYVHPRTARRPHASQYRNHIYKKLRATLGELATSTTDGPLATNLKLHPELDTLKIGNAADLDFLLDKLKSKSERALRRRHGNGTKATLVMGRPKVVQTREDCDIVDFFQYVVRPRGRPFAQREAPNDTRMDFVMSQYSKKLVALAPTANPASVTLLPPTASSLSAFKSLLMLRRSLLHHVEKAQQTNFCAKKTKNKNTLIPSSLAKISLTTVSKENYRVINVPKDNHFPLLVARFISLFFWPALLSSLRPNFPKEEEQPVQRAKKKPDPFTGSAGKKRKLKKPWVAEMRLKKRKIQKTNPDTATTTTQNGTEINVEPDVTEKPRRGRPLGSKTKKLPIVIPESERRRSRRQTSSKSSLS